MKRIRYRIALICAIVLAGLLCGCGKEESKPLSYEETTQIPIGLVSTPDGGHSEAWTEQLCADYIETEKLERLDTLFSKLKPWSFTPNACAYFYADDTLFCGAELKYIGEDENDHITIALNPDHPVSMAAYSMKIGQSNNQIGETPVWCGHSIRYWGRYDDPDVETDDCYYAAFQTEGVNYIVAAEGISETFFTAALTHIVAILTDSTETNQAEAVLSME